MSKVLSALSGALPDERPLLSLQIVETVAKCPTGYWPVSRTYDEDTDAGLLRQNGLFGKKPSHYICLSKTEGVPGYVMDGVVVVGEREAAPAGFSVAGRAGKRRLCTRVSRPAAARTHPPVTDVIVCSKMRQAPQGFVLAGSSSSESSSSDDELIISYLTRRRKRFNIRKDHYLWDEADFLFRYRMPKETVIYLSILLQDKLRPTTVNEINGKVVCYKVTGGSPDSSPTHNEYENIVTNITPEANRRLKAPDRPPKLSPLVSELNNLNLKQSPTTYPNIEEFTTDHDYEALSPSYNVKPSRPAPRPPSAKSPIPHGSPALGPTSPVAHSRKKGPAPLPRNTIYQTLGGYNGMEGVPFVLNPKLRGLPSDNLVQLPTIKRRTRFELDRDYTYNFTIERQT